MILYGDGTHYVSTCYEIIVMRVHFMTVHITVQHVIIYGQRKVKCKASATIIVRSLCLFTFLAQASCPPLSSMYSINVSTGRFLTWHATLPYST